MAEVINFNKARKRRARTQAEQEAAANRAKFGRTKAEKLRDELETEQARQRLEQLKLETPPED